MPFADLFQGALDLAAQNRFEAAMEAFAAAERVARASLAASHSDTARYDLGRLLYSKAAGLVALSRSVEALGALAESETLYGGLRASMDVDRLSADIAARRGLAQSQRGFLLSAIVEFERAIGAYVARSGSLATPRSDLIVDLARVLALCAMRTKYFLDPDLGVACADQAIMLYLDPRFETNDRRSYQDHHFIGAIETACEIHGASRRFELATQADTVAIVTARRMLKMERPGAARFLAERLAVAGVHLRAAGKADEAAAKLAESRNLEPGAVERATDEWQLVEAGTHPVLDTLARALCVAKNKLGGARVGDALERLVREPVVTARDGVASYPPLTTSDRCVPEERVPIAIELGELALELLPYEPVPARRLGFEAHVLLLSAAGTHHVPAKARTRWMELLTALATSCETRGLPTLAQDLREHAERLSTSG